MTRKWTIDRTFTSNPASRGNEYEWCKAYSTAESPAWQVADTHNDRLVPSHVNGKSDAAAYEVVLLCSPYVNTYRMLHKLTQCNDWMSVMPPVAFPLTYSISCGEKTAWRAETRGKVSVTKGGWINPSRKRPRHARRNLSTAPLPCHTRFLEFWNVCRNYLTHFSFVAHLFIIKHQHTLMASYQKMWFRGRGAPATIWTHRKRW